MTSFFQIGAQQSASLTVVAPGIAEALFATAIGLFAAIPAVIAYNRFGGAVGRYEAGLHRFADRLHAGLSRELDRA
jgi:biopolymer transport protein TolQ